MNGWNLFEEMLDKMGAEKLLEDLAFALSDKELEDNGSLNYICMANINYISQTRKRIAWNT